MNRVENKQLKYEKALEYDIFVKEEYGFAEEKIKEAECIFDIWWHIWLFSKWCRKLNLNAEIHYFEPVGEFYKKAKESIWNDDKIFFNNYWIASEKWEWVIFLNEEKTMQSSKYTSFLNQKWRGVAVNFVTLKDYLQQGNIDKIDVLKMDIEWMEFEVLDSFSDFEREKIESLIVEVHILNDEMKLNWNQIFLKLKNIFWNVKIINSWYREEIFLLRANK